MNQYTDQAIRNTHPSIAKIVYKQRSHRGV